MGVAANVAVDVEVEVEVAVTWVGVQGVWINHQPLEIETEVPLPMYSALLYSTLLYSALLYFFHRQVGT